MSNSILVTFFEDDSRGFIQQAIHKMTHGDEARLHDWGKYIVDNTHVDPAKALLQALIFADAPRILADLTDPTSNSIKVIFYDTDIVYEGGVRQAWDTDDYAGWIDDHNYIYEDEEYKPTSTALVHLANYLRGDLRAAKPLLYAIINRIWRDVYDGHYSRIARAAFLLHTYLFHYKGWSPHTTDFPVGVIHDFRSHLAGKDIHMTTPREWDDCATTPHYGRHDFAVVPRVSRKLWTAKGAHLTQRITFQFRMGIQRDELVLGDFGDDGVALITQFEGHEVAYFLSWPRDYEDPLQDMFNVHAISDAAHRVAPKHTREEELEEEYDDDWDTFQSI